MGHGISEYSKDGIALAARAYPGFDRAALFANRLSEGANRVRAHCRGDDERFRIVHDVRLESAGRALDDGFFALDEIKNVHAASRVMRNRSGEPVPPRFDELEFMQ